METDSRIYGIIHIGSMSLSLRVVRYGGVNDIQVLEEVWKEVSFGEEAFVNKYLSFASIRRLCDMLSGLKQLLADYDVKEYAVYATAVFREAKNRRAILDLIHVNTGFTVEIIDMPQEIYYKHFALQYKLHLRDKEQPGSLGTNFLYVDITSGCLGLTLWEEGALKYQQNVHMGTLRLLEMFKLNQRRSRDFPQAMEEYVHSIMMPLWKSIGRYHPQCLVMSGHEARMIATLLGMDMGKREFLEIRPSDFRAVFDKTVTMPPALLMRKFGLNEQSAEAVLPTAYIYKEILEHVPATRVVMMGTTFIEAATAFYGARRTAAPALLWMRHQNLELTRSIAARYYYEPEHAAAMETFSHTVIEAFRSLNGLSERDEFLLRMAIILCQVGKYVNLLGRSAQACQIVKGIDIFGLSDKEKDIVACIVFYDHSRTPSDDDEPFAVLEESTKMTVLKLIAIFRIVRAMDVGRKQKLKNVTADLQEDGLLISYDSDENTALETWIFEKEKEFFRNVFGIDAELVKR